MRQSREGLWFHLLRTSTASVAPPMPVLGLSPTVATGVPAGAFMAEGLLSVPGKNNQARVCKFNA